jgi:hypothetical protein
MQLEVIEDYELSAGRLCWHNLLRPTKPLLPNLRIINIAAGRKRSMHKTEFSSVKTTPFAKAYAYDHVGHKSTGTPVSRILLSLGI